MKWTRITNIPSKDLMTGGKKENEGVKMYSVVYTNYLHDCNEKALVLPDMFAPAIIGVAHQFNKSLAIYDSAQIIKILMDREDMSENDAKEHFEYNIKGSYVGEDTPLFLDHIRDILL